MESKLTKQIGTLLGVLIVINSTIGTGIFKKSANIVRFAGSIEAGFAVWIVGAVITLCGVLSILELAASMPRAGGMYEYLRRTYHHSFGFVFGWTKLTLLIPSAIGSFAKLSAEAIASLLHLPNNPTRDSFISVAVIAACTAANLLGFRSSSIQQIVLTTVKYLGVAFIAFVGIGLTVSSSNHLTVPQSMPSFATTLTFGGFCAALIPCMWCYDGCDSLVNLAAEVKSMRVLTRSIVLGTIAIIGIYLVANVGYAHILGVDGLRSSTTGTNMVAANLAYLTLGNVGRVIISAIILTSCIGVCLTSLYHNSRVFVPMSSDGVFFRTFGHVSDNGIPVNAILLSAGIGCLDVCFKSFDQLTDAAIIGGFPFYALAVIAVLVLRYREPQLLRPFRVPLFPAVPLAFLAGCVVFMVGACQGADGTAMMAFAVMLSGFPIYFARIYLGKVKGLQNA